MVHIIIEDSYRQNLPFKVIQIGVNEFLYQQQLLLG